MTPLSSKGGTDAVALVQRLALKSGLVIGCFECWSCPLAFSAESMDCLNCGSETRLIESAALDAWAAVCVAVGAVPA